MYNFYEHMKEATARRCCIIWQELGRAVYTMRREAGTHIPTATALERIFKSHAATAGEPHPLEESFNRMLALTTWKG